MKDMEAHLEKLRRDAAECAIIRDLATDPKKRDLFTNLGRTYVRARFGCRTRATTAGSSVDGWRPYLLRN